MSVKTFSDFPYYLLYDYFAELSKYYNIDSKPEDNIIKIYDAVTFESPWLDGTSNDDFLDFGNYYNKNESNIKNIRLRGSHKNIIAQGGEYTQFYAKIENYGYKPVSFRTVIDEEGTDENGFHFDKKDFDEYIAGLFSKEQVNEIIAADSIEKIQKIVNQEMKKQTKYVGEKLKHNTYGVIDHISTNDNTLKEYMTTNAGQIVESKIDITESKPGKTHALKSGKKKQLSEDIELQAENELYLRKDSFLFKGFNKNLKYLGDMKTDNGMRMLSDTEKENSQYFIGNHENYINDNLLYNFVGCTGEKWPDKNKGKVFHRSLKDFMIAAIPFNDMGVKLKSFIGEHFDRVYQEIYNMQKNIYCLLDPEETYAKFLGFLSLFYGIDIDKFSIIPEQNQRGYIKNLPYFLKKKGSGASLGVSGQCIIDKDNKIEFYERGHSKNKIQRKTYIDVRQSEVIDV